MSDAPRDPPIDDPDDLLAIGLHVAFQARAVEPAHERRGPVISRIESQDASICSVLLPASPEETETPNTTPLPPEELPSGVGKYQILGELGRGGLGIVLKARDLDLGRDTAMKVLLHRRGRSSQVLQRFVEEAQVAGQLQHPSIVPVYEMGLLPDASPFFTMKLVNGRTLAALMQHRGDTPDDRLRLLQVFEQVCQAMAYAHSRGVIHRDLKPANVMVGAFGEVQVMDWGLSKVLVETAHPVEPRPAPTEIHGVETIRSLDAKGESLPGTVIGTPAYMPPEQARGHVALMDKRSDVFSLGAILAEILTGEPPYGSATAEQSRRLASDAALEPTWRRLEASGADAALVRLSKACLSPSPDDRPQDAGKVADELRAHFVSVEERARVAELARERALARAASERKARRLTVALAGLILMSLVVGGSSYALIERDRWGREEATARAVDEAIQESTLLLGQARSAPAEEVAKWSEAMQAARRAATLAATADGNSAMRARVAGLLEELRRGEERARKARQQSQTDREMVERLEEIRLSRADPASTDWRKQDEAYYAAFKAYGIDSSSASLEAAAERIRGSQIRAELIVALDEWVQARMSIEGLASEDWRKLSQIAAAADPDPWRVRLRELAHTDRFDELRAMASDPSVSSLPASSACLLALWLDSTRDRSVAIQVCRAGVERHPQDFWLNIMLGTWLLQAKEADPKASSRYFTAAVALRPTASRAWNCLGCALDRLKDSGGAITAYRQALQLDPDSYHALNNLGGALVVQGDLDAAVPILKKAIEVGPDFVEARMNIGRALEKQGKLAEAVDCYQNVLRIDPQQTGALISLAQILEKQGQTEGVIQAYRDYLKQQPGNARVHLALGILLARKQKLELAIPEMKEAIRLRPDLAESHANLGTALLAAGDAKGSAAALREAIRLDPTFAQAYSNLSAAYERLGEPSSALAACREAVRIRPDFAQGHFNLGVCLENTQDTAGAMAAFNEAARLDPDMGDAHLARGGLLEDRGLYAEALDAYRAADSWSRQNPRLRENYEARVRDCGRRADLASRLKDFLDGSTPLPDAATTIELAEICHARGLYPDAFKLWVSAFGSDPELERSLESGNRYAAACSAALAGCRQQPDPWADREAGATQRYRMQALAWLRDDLAGIEAASSQPEADVKSLSRLLKLRRRDPDLDCFRAPLGLTLLPEAERAAWGELWKQTDALLGKLSPPTPFPTVQEK
jgi:serine/threonine-protein kinase